VIIWPCFWPCYILCSSLIVKVYNQYSCKFVNRSLNNQFKWQSTNQSMTQKLLCMQNCELIIVNRRFNSQFKWQSTNQSMTQKLFKLRLTIISSSQFCMHAWQSHYIYINFFRFVMSSLHALWLVPCHLNWFLKLRFTIISNLQFCMHSKANIYSITSLNRRKLLVYVLTT
jgi:hypothetical protein